MKKNIFLTLLLMLMVLNVAAQDDVTSGEGRASRPVIRYVSKNGRYDNDGESWEKSKNNVQDAINDLVSKGLTGEVWVAQGTYTPTESTEKTGGSTLYMSFQVPAGITVRGGFFGKDIAEVDMVYTDEQGVKQTVPAGSAYPGEGIADDRVVNTYTQTFDDGDLQQTVKQDWTYKYTTVFSGNLAADAKFEWDSAKNNWTTSFYGNCYHVVWFATEGFDSDGRAIAINTSKGPAMVEGVTIKNGNARNPDINGRFHTAYGGGAYMVDGSRLENCRIVNCEASRDGGGIYMDGGGIALHCYVANNQALGIGVQNGYGGGVCMDYNGYSNRFGIYRSVIVGNVGRLGGGLAIKVENKTGAAGHSEIPYYYLPFVSAVLVGNNTATTEGGGVYTLGGGAMTNMTVVRNRCNGTGIIANNMQTGRAGGMYCRDHALVLNSVFWGNECDANDGIQFAATKSGTTVANVNMQYCALSKSDFVDWSSTTKMSVFNISEYNNGKAYLAATDATEVSEYDVFPNFLAPTDVAGYNEQIEDAVTGGDTQAVCWIPGPNSGLANAGIVSHDLNLNNDLPFVATPSDILGIEYNSRSTIGAYTREFGKMTPVKTDLCDENGVPNALGGSNDETAWHFFVDPNASTATNSTTHGVSWDSPARFLGNVLETIEILRDADYSGDNEIGITDRVFIHVKEGTTNTNNSYSSQRVRDVSLVVPSYVTILGGYPEELTGTELYQKDDNDKVTLRRNPLWYPTFVTGEIISGNYEMNSVHLIALNGVNSVVIDGLQLRYANARSKEHDNTVFDGGGINMRDVADVQVRNSLVAGCTAIRGAAVFVRNGRNVTFENCIFHNNEAKAVDTLSGVVFVEAEYESDATNNYTTTFNHCNILNNVGHGIIVNGKAKQVWVNSMAFANMREPRDECYITDDPDAFHDLLAEPHKITSSASASNITVTNCLWDENFKVNDVWGTLSHILNKKISDKNASGVLDNTAFPRFVNGVKNVGVSEGGDITFYGRATSFEPHNDNPMVNAASHTDADHTKWGTDMTTIITRDYGGLPDIGAVENHVATTDEEGENSYVGGQQPYGTIVYVRDYNTYNLGTGALEKEYLEKVHPVTGEELDGSSWENAINGNAVYTTDSYTIVTQGTTLALPEEFVSSSVTASDRKILKIAMLAGGRLNSTPYYVYYNNGRNYQDFRGSTNAADGDNFVLVRREGVVDGYYIYNVDRSGYMLYPTSYSNGLEITTNDEVTDANRDRATWLIVPGIYREETAPQDEIRTYNIIPYNAQGYSWNYYGGTAGYLSVWGNTDANAYWQFHLPQAAPEDVKKTEDVRGLRYAIDIASEKWNTKKDEMYNVYVGAGKYYDNLVIQQGVNVLGGFPREGNPGLDERNISNNTSGYMTILDGDKKGRVLTQRENFEDATTLIEGFILQNGETTGTEYGAGVKLMKNGIVKNCLIYHNHFKANDQTLGYQGGGGAYIEAGGVVKNCIIKSNTITGGHGRMIGGAGVYSAGGIFQNSLIVENTATNNFNILGAGLYISSQSNLYNCTIAYNVADNTTHATTGGVWDGGAGVQYDSNNQVIGYATPSMFYNCIIWGNYAKGTTKENYIQVGMSGFSGGAGLNDESFRDCYSSAANKATASDIITDAEIENDKVCKVFAKKYGLAIGNDKGNVAVNYEEFYSLCKEYEPFKKIKTVDEDGNIIETTDYSLASVDSEDNPPTSIHCINKGDTGGDWNAQNLFEDIVGSPRILDCTVDKGAYEFNDAYAITPEIHEGRTILENSQTVEFPDTAFFYVTPDGHGLASADSPKNAACAEKLQKVLDAAGRYKYQNKGTVVVVRVAYSNSMVAVGENFTYGAARTSDETSSDIRQWSIIVPRGVEVWGGYSDVYNKETGVHGFYTEKKDSNNKTVYIDNKRSITGYPTYFHSYFNNAENLNVVWNYHVITFSDKVFDGNGKPYLENDALTGPSSYTGAAGEVLMSMKEDGGVTDRAVIDGIFITGGRANLQTYSSGAGTVNINRYGGAAIVTDYAHVRNCIVRDNLSVYGGALALTHGALVTGCLIENNTASYGGAIYVFPDGTTLSNDPDNPIKTVNGNYRDDSQDPIHRYDTYMPHVISSTIVNNKANVQGGGVWFTNNVRFNSVAIWQNDCQDQANVSGTYNVTRPDNQSFVTTEFHPFNFSAIENIQPSGLNNVSVKEDNKYGMRFYCKEYKSSANADPNNTEHIFAETSVKDGVTDYSDFGYFLPSAYSVLTRGGMPVSMYEETFGSYAIAETDFMGVPRRISKDGKRRFLEIGALVNNRENNDHGLMLRLFVAKPENVDPNAVLAMAMTPIEKEAKNLTPTEYEYYYSQEGSSFAHPFARLQDALDYIYIKRGYTGNPADHIDEDLVDGKPADDITAAVSGTHANNMAFEIFLGPGTFYPTVDLAGENKNALSNTFLIPEGVTLIGGHDPENAIDSEGNDKPTEYGTDTSGKEIVTKKHFLGAYYRDNYKDPKTSQDFIDRKYYVAGNVKPIYEPGSTTDIMHFHTVTYDGVEYVIHHVDKDKVTEKRKLEDINANSVIEPWEFAEQTILSGKIEGVDNNGANHIVTIIADEQYVGALPSVQGEGMFTNPTDPNNSEYGYVPHEHGQIVAFDGLTFMGGYAHGYQPNTIDDVHKLKYNHGAAILVDGNRYWNSFNYPDQSTKAEIKHSTKSGAVAWREIPVMINRCKFENNIAGYGGAISTNTTLDVMNSSFEHNKAMSGKDEVDYNNNTGDTPILKYAGVGGAIYGTYQVSAVNTIFENNEAVYLKENGTKEVAAYSLAAPPSDFTVFTDIITYLEANNNNNNNNNNIKYYTMLGGAGGAVYMARKGHFHFMNCNFVRNQANAYPAIYTLNPNYQAMMEPKEEGGYVSLKDYNQAFNCVFWGNEVNEIMKTEASNTDKHLFAVGKVVNYGKADRKDSYQTETGHTYQIRITSSNVAFTQEQLDKEYMETDLKDADGTPLDNHTEYPGYTEQIWFSAYEEGRGKTPKNSKDLRDMPFSPRVHVKRQICEYISDKSVGGADGYEDYVPVYPGHTEDYKPDESYTNYKYQNCNVLLASDNAVSDGPNFVNPSANSGYDGYVESADWSPARINQLTDNGWGKIKQIINPETMVASFAKYGTDNPLPTEPADRVYGSNPYSSESDGKINGKEPTYVVDGAYSALRYMNGNEKYQKTMPIGEQDYMYASFNGGDGKPVPFYRISYDPNPTHNQTYIDMGVYEYYHAQLEPSQEGGDQVDVLWVTALEKDNSLANGKTWQTPTSDLQRAIETLLSSRNGRRKEIRLLDGVYVPTYTIHDHLGFYINTMSQNSTVIIDNPEAPDSYGKGVMSLTIKGGYSSTLPNARDVDEYPAVIKQQKRSDNESKRWDHLFYIADLTQRYAIQPTSGEMETYHKGNGYGHLYEGIDNTITTIPIEFDGVTLVNDQALPGTQGAAIHYAGLTDILNNARKNAEYDASIKNEDFVIQPSTVNVTTSDESESTHTYISVSTPAKIILSKTKIYGSGTHNQADDRTTSSAVYLGDVQGGDALLYNNVMHSNYGDPLVSGCKTLTINNTFALNGGYVKLDGAGSTIHNSVLWKNNPEKDGNGNFIMGTDSYQQYGAQFSLLGFGLSNGVKPTKGYAGILSHNSYTNSVKYKETGPANERDYNDASGDVEEHAYNTALYSDNSNFILGPNFVDPENDDVEKRNFMLKPSLRLMNKGWNDNYSILKKPEGETSCTGSVYDIAYAFTYNEDAASLPRHINDIDLGAYEYQNRMKRVVYMDPNKRTDDIDENSGESWEHPMPWGALQNAIDLAALYHSNNPKEQAFVFVRGTSLVNERLEDWVHTDEVVTLRNGVSIFGGISDAFLETCARQENADKTYTHTDDAIEDYLNRLNVDNEGFIGPNTNRTAIKGIVTNEYTVFDTESANPTDVDKDNNSITRKFRIESKIQGFHVLPVDVDLPVGAPVIDIDPRVAEGMDAAAAKVVLSHIAVYDNKASDATSATPLAQMKNSLIYGSLFRDNTPGTNQAVLQLNEGAYAVSCTVQGVTESLPLENGAYGSTHVRKYNGHGKLASYTQEAKGEEEKKTRIHNSIVNYDLEDNEMREGEDVRVTDQTKYTLSGWNYRRNDHNMYFQLAEGSKHINEIAITSGESGNEFLPVNMRPFVNYSTDRDMIGNPRLLTLVPSTDSRVHGGERLLDRGAFETWKVEDDITTTTEGHFAPHTGSVVYIAEGKSLICGTELQPGFLLLKDGASLYGNGQNVKVSFVSVEREIQPGGSVVSLPFEMDYSRGANFSDGIARSYYEDVAGNLSHDMNGILHLEDDANATKVYEYKGDVRMEHDYDFSPTSGAWAELVPENRSNTIIPANTGVLVVPAPKAVKDFNDRIPPYDENPRLIYSFTSMGNDFKSMVYEEKEGEEYKSVTLTQYDDYESTGGGADFTSKEDMGWNCIGLPYLVSEYKTYTVKDGVYNMDIPHELWLYYDGNVDAAGNMLTPDGSAGNVEAGGFYSVPSWESDYAKWHLAETETPRIWIGEGFFVQTAAVNDMEEVYFYRPVPPTASEAKLRTRNARYYVSDSEEEEELATPLRIWTHKQTVYISGLEGDEHISIYDSAGRMHHADRASDKDYSTDIPDAGVYIVKVNNVRKKVFVK